LNYDKHLKIGLLVEIFLFILLFLIFRFTLSSILIFKIFVVVLVSPLIMDLDHFNGKLRNLITALGLLIANYGLFLYLMSQDIIFSDIEYISTMILGIEISTISFFIAFFFKHRGFIHSILFCLIYGAFLYIALDNVYISIIGLIGCYTHLVLDNEKFKIY